jgi:hypothetical protein
MQPDSSTHSKMPICSAQTICLHAVEAHCQELPGCVPQQHTDTLVALRRSSWLSVLEKSVRCNGSCWEMHNKSVCMLLKQALREVETASPTACRQNRCTDAHRRDFILSVTLRMNARCHLVYNQLPSAAQQVCLHAAEAQCREPPYGYINSMQTHWLHCDAQTRYRPKCDPWHVGAT